MTAPRYRLVLVDQALYAASNLAAVVVAGRVADRDGFGWFMLAFLGLSVAVNGVRAVWSEPEMARRRASARPAREVAVVVAGATSMVAAAGIAGRVPWVAVGAAAGVSAGLQDRLRYQALLRHDMAALVRSDALWAMAMAAGGIALTGPAAGAVRPAVDVTTVLGLWTLGAAAATVVNLPPATGAAARRTGPDPVGATGPIPAAGAIARRSGADPVGATGATQRGAAARGVFLADFALQSGATQAAGLVLGLIMASGPYGELRAAITLLGPIGVANSALVTQLLGGRPAGARLVAGIGGGALVVVAMLVAVPGRLGSAALGSAWPGRSVLVLIGATVAAQTVSAWGLTRLKLARRGGYLLLLRAGAALGLAGATATAAVVSGRAVAVAAAYLAVNALLAVACTARSGRRPRPAGTVAAGEVDPDATVAADRGATVGDGTATGGGTGPGLARTV